jgi:hypothetical protein
MFVIGKPKGKKQLGRPKCRRKGNNEMELVETKYENVDRFIWFWTAICGTLVNTVINLRAP